VLNNAQGDDLNALFDLLQNRRRVFVLTGAGCSTESGIPDYRDHTGQWKQRQPVQYREFVDKPEARRRYWARSMVGWRRFAAAQPNPSHQALARLEDMGLVSQLVTQNVDRLHQKAGSRTVIDLHGRLDKVACLSCHRETARKAMQQRLEGENPQFAPTVAKAAPDGDAHVADDAVGELAVPECEACGGVLKPTVVFFGESVPRARVTRAMQALLESDVMLVAGSSLMLYSGYRFCVAATERQIPIVAVNLGQTRADDQLSIKVQDSCATALPRLVEDLARLSLHNAVQ